MAYVNIIKQDLTCDPWCSVLSFKNTSNAFVHPTLTTGYVEDCADSSVTENNGGYTMKH